MKYTSRQLDFVRKKYPKMSLIELTAAFNVRFSTSRTVQHIRALTRNHRIKSGRTGCFEPGQQSWNTGTKGLGICKPNSGSFKKGNVPGNTRPLGSHRIDSKDGYLLLKVTERNPYTGSPARFRGKHVVLWEKKHGKVPIGHAVVFRDGNKERITLSNLMLVSRAELLQMNRLKYKEMPDALKPSVLALSKLKVSIGAKRKKIRGGTNDTGRGREI